MDYQHSYQTMLINLPAKQMEQKHITHTTHHTPTHTLLLDDKKGKMLSVDGLSWRAAGASIVGAVACYYSYRLLLDPARRAERLYPIKVWSGPR